MQTSPSSRNWRGVFAPLVAVVGLVATSAPTHAARMFFADESPWITFDGPLWDFSDDGLPFRLSIVQPAAPDPIGHLLRATDQQWAAWVGYAEVFSDSSATGQVTATGGDSYFFGVGRQWRWRLPEWTSLGDWRPHFTFETGLNYADDSLPAGGTHFNFPVVSGFEWARRNAAGAETSPLIFGFRWFHLSNAGVRDYNSGYDGFIFRVGYRWGK